METSPIAQATPRPTTHRPQPPRWRSDLSTISTISFRTFSSFDADDELGTSSDMTDDESSTADQMADGLADGPAPRRYLGEDVRQTSKKELLGWYAYGFAAETYIICGA